MAGKIDLAKATSDTLAHYDSIAESFRERTHDHDVSQNINALLEAITVPAPVDILDLGCGPGRDLKQFAARGHRPVGVEGAAAFARMGREAGFEVWEQNFLNLDLPPARFDGIFANATLFHVPTQELPRVLGQLFETLRPGGVLFSSNPHGQNEERYSNGRFGAFHDLAQWQQFLTGAGFVELSHYYRPEGLPREEQPWLASLWRKVGSKTR